MPPLDKEAPADPYTEMSSVFDSLMDSSNNKPAEPAEGATPTDAAAAKAQGEAKPAEGEAKPAEAKPAEGEAKPAEGEAASTEQVEGEATPAEGEEPAPAKTEPDEGQQQAFDELSKRLDALEKPAPAAKEEPKKEAPPLYNNDEQAFLKKYEEEWPDIAKGEALRRRAEYQQMVGHIFSEVARVYGPLIEQSMQTADAFAEQSTLGYIRATHDDYDDTMYDAVVSWADKLPGYKGKLAKAVIAEGEPQDVVELISEFKHATGRAKPAAAESQTPAKQEKTELPAAAKKAAKALGVVESKRSANVTNIVDPNDFNGAWDEAIAS